MKKILFTLILLLPAFSAWSATYYIDWAGGDDTCDGSTKQTKAEDAAAENDGTCSWKRAPGMKGCWVGDGTACATKAAAGIDPDDQFILKGGVTWPNAALPYDLIYGGGTSGHTVYIGVDATWYTGVSWARPILNAEGTAVADNSDASLHNVMMRSYNGYFVIDNIEFTGLIQDSDTYYPSMLQIGTGTEVKNCYFHGWSHGGTATQDRIEIIGTGTEAAVDLTQSIHDCVLDGSDSTSGAADSGKLITGMVGHVYKNYLGYATNALCCAARGYIWGNTFDHISYDNFDAGTHINNIENEGGLGTVYIYNNFFTSPSGGCMLLYPKDGYHNYVFNNVVINDDQQTIQLGSKWLTSNTVSNNYIWNNSLHAISTGNTRISGDGFSTYHFNILSYYNNHLIGSSTDLISEGNYETYNHDNNLEWTWDTMTTNNYNVVSTYPLYPPSGGATVDAGTSMTDFCATLTDNGPSAPTTACTYDTTLGVDYNATTHTVTYPKRTALARSTWDIGAYELDVDTPPPADPTYAINTAGSSFTVTFAEAVTHGAGGTTGWVLTSDGGAVTATYSSGAGSTALVYQLSRTVYSTETVTGTYTQPEDPGITDIAGNRFATVTDEAITNNSTATAGAPTYPKMTLSTGSNVTLSPSGTGSFTLAP